MLKQIFFSKPVVFLEIAVLVFFGIQVGKEFLAERAMEREVADLKAEIEKLERNEDNLSALIEYAKTDSFVESEAKKKLNLTKKGESLVVIPGVDSEPEDAKGGYEGEGDVLGEKVIKESNLALWWKYFFDYDQLWIE